MPIPLPLQKKYGRLTVIKEVSIKDRRYKRRRELICRCDCGNIVQICLSNVARKSLATTSCGCLQRERTIEVNTKPATEPVEEKIFFTKPINIENWDLFSV